MDRLGDLDEEITRACACAEAQRKLWGDEADTKRFDEALKDLLECQKQIQNAKTALIEFDGLVLGYGFVFPSLSDKTQAFLSRLGNRVSNVLERHVGNIIQEGSEGARRLASEVQALRNAAELEDEETLTCKDNVKAIEKVLAMVRKALDKLGKKSLQKKTSFYHGYQL